MDIKKDTHLVLKYEDIEMYCGVGDLNALDFIRHKIRRGREKDGRPTNNCYYICNVDEPYAESVIKAIIDGEDMKEQYDCGCCQREDAPCDNCIRNSEIADKEDPDLEDHYFHD